MPGEQRTFYRCEPQADSDCRPSFSEVSRDEEFVVAEAAVGRLHDMLCGPGLLLWVGVDAGIRPGQIPNSCPFPILITLASAGIGDKNFRALVGERVIKLAPQQD